MKLILVLGRLLYGLLVLGASLSLYWPAVYVGQSIVPDDSSGPWSIDFPMLLGTGLLFICMASGALYGLFSVLSSVKPLLMAPEDGDSKERATVNT